MANFVDHIDDLLALEGGGIVHTVQGDPGGTTKWGIAQNSHPDVDVKSLSRAGALDIYQKEYWNALRLSDLEVPDDHIGKAIAENLFFYAVHAGTTKAGVTIQQTLNYIRRAGQPVLKTDGDIGPKTIMAFNSAVRFGDADVLLRVLVVLIGSMYLGLYNTNKFHADRIRGYMRRVQV